MPLGVVRTPQERRTENGKGSVGTGPSNVAKGAYYKNRTRKWLAAQGYTVFDLETVRYVQGRDGQRVPVKRDQLGCDLGGVRGDGFVFVQVKFGYANKTAQIRCWREYTWPIAGVKLWLVRWTKGAHEPEVDDLTMDVQARF